MFYGYTYRTVKRGDFLLVEREDIFLRNYITEWAKGLVLQAFGGVQGTPC